MQNNTTILANAFLEASTDFQQRVPDPSQHSVAQVSEFLFKPMNKKYLNEFMDIFVNRIAGELMKQRDFRNPLKRKRADLTFGTTIQEIELDFIKAHAFKDDWGHRIDDITNLLKVYRPDGQVAYHSVDRYDQYPISINRVELRGAFTGEYGLNQLASKIMQVPFNSAEYDEYGYYKQLIAEHEYRHGFFKHHVSAIPSNEATGKEFLTALQMYADLITIPNKLYNANDATVPTWINADERPSIVLYIEAAPKAALNVQTLAAVFQLQKAEIPYRIQFIDSIPIPGAFALLTTDDFWVCADYEVSNDSFFNPQTRTETYYYTVIGLYSTSPFVPAILFTTATGTTTAVVTETPSGLTLTPNSGTVAPGEQLALVTTLTGSLSADPNTYQIPNTLSVAPDSCIYEVALADTTYTGAGVYNFAVGGTVANGDKITIGGVTVTLDATSGASTSAAAGAVRTALAANAAFTNVYSTGGSGSDITVTEKSGHYGAGKPTSSITSTSGTLTGTTTTEPSSETTYNVTDVDTYVDRFGILHVGTMVPLGSVIHVDVTTTYDPQSGTRQSASGNFTVALG